MESNKNFFYSEKYNYVLFESHSFIAIPSLGSMVEGWLLVVPKEFRINLSVLSHEEHLELNSFIKRITANYRELFGEFVMFEHGPQGLCSSVGCGVDYAHLHIVPVKFDLKAGIKSLMDLDFDWHSIKGVRNISDMNSAKSEYLYYVDQYDNHFVAFDSRIPSQLFRKVIANYIGKPELYDWKTNPNYSIIDATLDRFSLNY